MRADVFLYTFGHVKSRQNAKALIEKGAVVIDGKTVTKASENIDDSILHTVDVEREKYVCRGALKLEGALEAFHIDVSGKTCIDIGASTGGFTDCLLQRGAARVYSVDSGHGQLDASLLENEKVVNIEGYNARNLSHADFDTKFEIAVMDVSFISQTYILPNIPGVLTGDGVLISLIKPQFEAGRGAVGKNGIVKKAEDREAAVNRVLSSAAENGLYPIGLMRSPIDGGDGNIEYLAYFCREAKGELVDRKSIKNIIKGERRASDGK